MNADRATYPVTVDIRNLRKPLAVAAWLAVVVVAIAAVSLQPPPMQTILDVTPARVQRSVLPADDTGKPGTMRSVMGQSLLWQRGRTTGPSPDVLSFEFDAPARILGINVSVDVAGLDIVEVAAGIEVEGTYGLDARDWLLHTSDSNGGQPSKIDEAAWFGEGFDVEAGESVDVVAWLYNSHRGDVAVSPEVIVYYRWQ